MKINFSSMGFDTSESLTRSIEEKLTKLGSKHDWIHEAKVHLKIDKNNKDKDKLIEIRLVIPGDDLYVHKNEERWDLAIRDVFTALDKQLNKQKNKDFDHPKTNPLKS